MNREQVLQTLWKDTCKVIVHDKVKNEQTKVTEFVERTLAEGQPCKLSWESLSAVGEGNTAAIAQSVKLFLSNQISVPAGSKIIVTRQGKTYDFQRSGEPAVFTFHQEVMLEPWKRWA